MTNLTESLHRWPLVEFVPCAWLREGDWVLDKTTWRCYVGPGVIDGVWRWLTPAEGSA